MAGGCYSDIIFKHVFTMFFYFVVFFCLSVFVSLLV